MNAHFKIFLLVATASFIGLIYILNTLSNSVKIPPNEIKLEEQKNEKPENITRKLGFKTAQLKLD